MSCCTPQGDCTQASNCKTRGSYQPLHSCQALGICKNRYPDCGRCDDYHPEDESETLTPMDHIYAWCISGAIVLAAFIGVCVLALSAGWTVHLVAKLWPV